MDLRSRYEITFVFFWLFRYGSLCRFCHIIDDITGDDGLKKMEI